MKKARSGNCFEKQHPPAPIQVVGLHNAIPVISKHPPKNRETREEKKGRKEKDEDRDRPNVVNANANVTTVCGGKRSSGRHIF
jgi:hypothetical protein